MRPSCAVAQRRPALDQLVSGFDGSCVRGVGGDDASDIGVGTRVGTGETLLDLAMGRPVAALCGRVPAMGRRSRSRIAASWRSSGTLRLAIAP
jgi:hypothetical protein